MLKQRKLFQQDVDQPPIDQIVVSVSGASSAHDGQFERDRDRDRDQSGFDVESVLSTSFKWELTADEKRQRIMIVDSIIRKVRELIYL